MTTNEQFDCIEYKRAIQAKHAAETQALSAREKIERRAQWLAESRSKAAQLWREMKNKQQ